MPRFKLTIVAQATAELTVNAADLDDANEIGVATFDAGKLPSYDLTWVLNSITVEDLDEPTTGSDV